MKKAVILLLAFFLLLWSGYSGQSRGDGAQLLRVAAMAGPLTFNPLFARDLPSAEITSLFFEPLLAFHPETLEPEGRLLKSWEIGDDGREYTLFLRRDARWSDGRPITADDVAFTIKVVCHPDYTGWLYLYLKIIEGAAAYREGDRTELADGEIAGLKVLDDFTLKVRLAEPFAPFLTYLAFPPLPVHVLRDTPVAELEGHSFSRKPEVFSGPYILSEWRPDALVRTQANALYYQGKPKIEYLYYMIIPNPEAQLIEILAGRIDLLPHLNKPEDIPMLRKDDSLAVYTTVRLAYDFIGFNLKNPRSPLADNRVRQALSMVVDRRELVDELLLGMGQVAAGPLSPLQFAYDKTFAGHEYDLEKAKELLEKSGRKPVQLRLIFNAGNLLRENVAVLYSQKAAAIGVSISVVPMEWEAFVEALHKGDFDLVLLGFGTGVDPDFSYHWHAGGSGNKLTYKNTEINRLLEEAGRLFSKQERTALYRQAQEILVADAPAIWLYYRKAVHVATASLINFRAHPDFLFYRVHEWERKECQCR